MKATLPLGNVELAELSHPEEAWISAVVGIVGIVGVGVTSWRRDPANAKKNKVKSTYHPRT